MKKYYFAIDFYKYSKNQKKLTLSGWFFSENAADVLNLYSDGELIYVLKTDKSRPDVKAIFKDKCISDRVGFFAEIKTEKPPEKGVCLKVNSKILKKISYKDLCRSPHEVNFSFTALIRSVFKYVNITLTHARNNGLLSTIKAIKRELTLTKKFGFPEKDYLNEVNLSLNKLQIKKINFIPKLIAVHLHLYYSDLLDEFIDYLNNIPYPFDLFVSCREESNIQEIKQSLKTIQNVKSLYCQTTINRGRDLAPLYVQFGKKISKYEYLLHIHTKKSLYSGKERYGWREYSLDCLLGSPKTVELVFSLFASEHDVGLFMPEIYDDVPEMAMDWLANASQGRRILNALSIPFEDGIFTYPVGSFFWAKMDAVRPLFDHGFKYNDFPEETGQTDGTTAHALERVLAFVVKHRGHKIAIHDCRDELITVGHTLKPFSAYFNLDVKTVARYLAGYDLISFDIFDTLITRCVYKPHDLYRLLQQKAKRMYGIDINFYEIRIDAEKKAWKKYKEFTSIHNIYEEFEKITALTHDQISSLKQLEIDLELSVCVPRKDMLTIFNYLKKKNKKIVLISDMYLTSEIINQLLIKCGYRGNFDIWVSCEKGGRKDNNTIWPLFFEVFGAYRTIHVGDNLRSDIQILKDQGKEAFFVMSSATIFKLSCHYNVFRDYMNDSIENSLVLGFLVNAGLYNSPFLKNRAPKPSIESFKDFGFMIFGPLFTQFIHALDMNSNPEEVFLFLSREGYFLEKLYEQYCLSLGKKANRHYYLLASRRAVSVPAIKNKQDIYYLLKQYYQGPIKNLLSERFGLYDLDKMSDFYVRLPEDKDKIIKILNLYLTDIYGLANEELKHYLSYFSGLISDYQSKELKVIDIGFSGTIQYYLSRILNKKVDGFYLIMGVEKKPLQIGASCQFLYSADTVIDLEKSKIFKGQLFLEAVLQAPYGQLIRFIENDDCIMPEYKRDSFVSENIKEIQKGILDYCNLFFKITKEINSEMQLDKNLSEEVFYQLLYHNELPEEIIDALNVEDGYCENGTHKFDVSLKKWVVQ